MMRILGKGVPAGGGWKNCAFWKADNSGYYIEEFANILKSKFEV